MENEELIYEYPTQEERQEIVEQLAISKINSSKKNIVILVLIIIGILGIFTSSFIGDKLEIIFFIVGIVTIILGFLSAKTLSEYSEHITMITAYETFLHLEIYSNSNDFLREIELNYDDIILCSLSKKYDKVTILYKYNVGSTYSAVKNSGEIIQKKHTGQITFDINPFSYEQYFFFYVAPKLFEIDMEEWKILKKFGNERNYIRKNNL